LSEVVASVHAADGVALSYRLAGGDGAPVALLHGSLAGPATFDELRAHLPDQRLLLPVLRGHEGPGGPSLPAAYGLTTTEVDDLATVLDAAGMARAHLIGHSTGGSVAVAFALRFPERVVRLALIEPTLWSVVDAEARARLHAEFDPVVAAWEGGDHDAALRAFLDSTGGSAWAALPEAVRRKVVDRRRPLAHLVGPHVRALLGYDVSAEDIVGLATPMFLVYGTTTMWFERPIADRLRELRPDVGQLHVEGAGHASHAERPEVVGPAIAAFLG
jgi:pimeloyl-ACP methyl ester carboxylesterase